MGLRPLKEIMLRFNVIRTSEQILSRNYTICKSILEDQGLKYSEIWDRMKVVKNGMGIVNPSNGFVIETPSGEFVLNYIQLMRYLDRKGLVRI